MHDPRLGRFFAVDPKASSYPFMSPYVYAANSPIVLIDKNGEGPEWYPETLDDGTVVLVKEECDDLVTLLEYKNKNLTEEVLTKLYNDMSESDEYLILPEDNYSRAFKYANENSDDFAKPDQSDIKEKSRNYNCYHFSLNGVKGGEIFTEISFFGNSEMIYDSYMMYMEDAVKELKTNFEKTDDPIYGETLIAFYIEEWNPKTYGMDKNYQHFGVWTSYKNK